MTVERRLAIATIGFRGAGSGGGGGTIAAGELSIALVDPELEVALVDQFNVALVDQLEVTLVDPALQVDLVDELDVAIDDDLEVT